MRSNGLGPQVARTLLATLCMIGGATALVACEEEPKFTKSMVLGFITRRQYLEHHEPSRWPVGPKSSSAKPAGQA